MFQALAYKCGLRLEDLESMTVGMILDYVNDYVEMQKPEEEKSAKGTVRRATQADFDAFAAS